MPLTQLTRRSHKPSFFAAAAYRVPLPVRQLLVFQSGDSYPICPRCDKPLNREYMRFCDCCGQHLAWELFDYAKIIPAPRAK